MTTTALNVPDTAGRTSVDRLFRPSSVAVVGASLSPGKLGTAMIEAISSGGSGRPRVIGINPRVEAPGFATSLSAATAAQDDPIDLAVLCIPAAATPAAVHEAAERGVGAVLICSGGFAEVGGDGLDLQRQLLEIHARTGIRILGPNTSGFFRPDSVIASFVPTVSHIRRGTVAVVAASGGMNHALSFLLSDRGVGVGFGVGLGNSVDIDTVDVLDYLATDPDISAVALHMESIIDGERLLESIRRLSLIKPVVAIIVGRTDVSAFAESHTGSLATSWRTSRSLMAEAGAVVVDSEHELADALTVLSVTRLPATPDAGVGLVTAQAGPGLIVLDELQSRGVRLPALADDTIGTLSHLLPPLTFQGNPVDTGRPGKTFADVIATTAADQAIDTVAIYALAEPDAVDIAGAVAESSATESVPVIVGIGGPDSVIENIRAPRGVPLLTTPTSLAAGVAALVSDARQQFLLLSEGQIPDSDSADRAIALPETLDESAAKDIVNRLGIGTPPRRVCRHRQDAHDALNELTAPVAVKILDANILHKTEIGGVHLGVHTHRQLDDALDQLESLGATSYLIESMAPSGVDLILGLRRDPVFGPLLVAGLGGIAAEAIGDVSIRGQHLTEAAAAAMLDDLGCAALLNGWRGGPTLDRRQFALIAVRLMRFLTARTDIAEIEINPLRLTSDGLVALDAVILRSDRQQPNQPAA